MELLRHTYQHLHSSKIMRPLFAFFAGLLLLSCGNKSNTSIENNGPKEEEILSLYKLYTSGNYNAYVDAMQSCDDKPETYRQEMKDALKQHARYIDEEHKGVKHVKLERTEVQDKGNMSNAFLNVSYGDGSTEEIMIQLVRNKDRWRIR